MKNNEDGSSTSQKGTRKFHQWLCHHHHYQRGIKVEKPGRVTKKDYLKATERWRRSDLDSYHHRRYCQRSNQCFSDFATYSDRWGSTWVVEGPCIIYFLTLQRLPGSICVTQQQVCHQRRSRLADDFLNQPKQICWHSSISIWWKQRCQFSRHDLCCQNLLKIIIRLESNMKKYLFGWLVFFFPFCNMH